MGTPMEEMWTPRGRRRISSYAAICQESRLL